MLPASKKPSDLSSEPKPRATEGFNIAEAPSDQPGLECCRVLGARVSRDTMVTNRSGRISGCHWRFGVATVAHGFPCIERESQVSGFLCRAGRDSYEIYHSLVAVHAIPYTCASPPYLNPKSSFPPLSS